MDHLEKYLALCYRYLTIRNRSEKEIRDYLTKKKVSEEIIEQLVALLYEQKFLNDEAFARSWIVQRARFRPKGKMALKIELAQKGISKDIIEQVMSEDNEELPDELTQAKALIERRIVKVKDLPRQEIYQKVGGFLARRGFPWEISKKAIDSSLAQLHNE